MKPNPLVGLNHLTVPAAMSVAPPFSSRCHGKRVGPRGWSTATTAASGPLPRQPGHIASTAPAATQQLSLARVRIRSVCVLDGLVPEQLGKHGTIFIWHVGERVCSVCRRIHPWRQTLRKRWSSEAQRDRNGNQQFRHFNLPAAPNDLARFPTLK